MKKQTRIGNVIVFGCFYLFVCGCDPPHQKEWTWTVSPKELMSDFVWDAYDAEQKYRYRRVILTGKIGRIQKKASAHYVNQWEYTLRMHPEVINGIPTEVYCYFNTSQASKLRYLSKGDDVKISGSLWHRGLSYSMIEGTGTAGILQRGTYSGTDKTFYFVKLHDCHLVETTTRLK